MLRKVSETKKNILLAGYLTKNKQQIVSDLNFFTFNIESSLFEIKGSRQEKKIENCLIDFLTHYIIVEQKF